MSDEVGEVGRRGRVREGCISGRRACVLLARSPRVGWIELRAILQDERRVGAVDDAAGTTEAVDLARRHQPDIIFAPSDISVARPLRMSSSASKIIVLGDRFDGSALLPLWALPIDGYLYWSRLTSGTVRVALAAVLDGDLTVVSSTARAEIMAPVGVADGGGVPVSLTQQERQVLDGLGAGLSEEAIADQMAVGPRTVRRVICSLKEKLGAPTLFALGMNAARLGVGSSPM